MYTCGLIKRSQKFGQFQRFIHTNGRILGACVSRALHSPSLHQLGQPGRSPGHQGHHLPEAGLFDPAGLAAATGGVVVVLQGHLDFEVGLVLAGGVTLGVAAAGLGAVSEGPVGGGHWRASCSHYGDYSTGGTSLGKRLSGVCHTRTCANVLAILRLPFGTSQLLF